MFTAIYNVKGIVDTYYDHENNLVVVEWKTLTEIEHFRKSCDAQLSAMEKYNSEILIVNTFKAIGIPYPQDQDWLINTLYPRIRKLNSHLIINVIPENQISKMGVKTWINSGEKNDINFAEVKTIEEAYEFAKSHSKNAH